MSICDKCVYSGHCLLEVSSVPTKCELKHERVDPMKEAPEGEER